MVIGLSLLTVGGIAAYGIYKLYQKRKKQQESETLLATQSILTPAPAQVEVSTPTSTPSAPPSTPSTPAQDTWVSESFPLKKGMKGKNVTRLQEMLGVNQDGYFGNETYNALVEKKLATEIGKARFFIWDKEFRLRGKLSGVGEFDDWDGYIE